MTVDTDCAVRAADQIAWVPAQAPWQLIALEADLHALFLVRRGQLFAVALASRVGLRIRGFTQSDQREQAHEEPPDKAFEHIPAACADRERLA
jgi:hypothetical protein